MNLIVTFSVTVKVLVFGYEISQGGRIDYCRKFSQGFLVSALYRPGKNANENLQKNPASPRAAGFPSAFDLARLPQRIPRRRVSCHPATKTGREAPISGARVLIPAGSDAGGEKRGLASICGSLGLARPVFPHSHSGILSRLGDSFSLSTA